MLGWGGTDKIYSFSDPAGHRIRHIKKLLALLGIDKAFFVGNSAGGGTVLRASVMDPVPLEIQQTVTTGGDASGFKTISRADPECYTPPLDDMQTVCALLHDDWR